MAFDRSVIPHPTGTTGVAVLADLAFWVVFACAGRAPGRPAGRALDARAPRRPRAGDPCGGGARGPRRDHDAVRLRKRTRAASNVRLQFERWEQAGLAFDEIAVRRDIDPAVSRRRADRRRQRRCCSTSAWYPGASSHRSR